MKGLLKLFFIGVMTCSLLTVANAGFSFEDGDWQYWNTESVEGKIVDVGTDALDSIHAKIEGEFRFGDDLSEFYYQHLDLGLKFKKLFVPWFNLGFNYRQVWEKKFSDDGDFWFDEYRPHINPEFSFKVNGWSIKDRVRLEFRNFDADISEKEDVLRLRNKISIKPPVKWTDWAITPYLADEIFMEENKDGINRNRLYVGLSIGKLFKLDAIKADLYFLWQASEKSDEWIDVYAIGTKLKVHF